MSHCCVVILTLIIMEKFEKPPYGLFPINKWSKWVLDFSKKPKSTTFSYTDLICTLLWSTGLSTAQLLIFKITSGVVMKTIWKNI